jgi:hypothetical protein
MEEYEHDRLLWRAQFWAYCECNCVYEIDDILGYLEREQQYYMDETTQICNSTVTLHFW